MKINYRELYLVPNILTLIRLVFMPLPVIMIAQGKDSIALALLAFAIFTDVADGIIARRFNQISELGKVLDPLADKLGTAALVITLVIYRDFPWWAAAVIIIRDLFILVGGLVFLSKIKAIPTSNFFGKLTALAWTLLIISYLLPFPILRQVLLIISVAMVPISVFLYFRNRVHSMHNSENV